MTVNELKVELKKRNQKVGGEKAELQAQLREALDNKAQVGPPPKNSKQTNDKGKNTDQLGGNFRKRRILETSAV